MRAVQSAMLSLLALTLATATASPRTPGPFHRAGTASTPSLELSGYSWAENLAFDGLGSLYVSDTEEGRIWRIWLENGAWTQELFFDQALGVNGLASDGVWLYANIKSLDTHYEVVRIPIGTLLAEPERIVTLPFAGNGMELDEDGLLYVTTEGNFVPGKGAVYRVFPEQGIFETLVGGLWAANGIAIDRDARLLYVTQVVNNKVKVVELPSGTVLETLDVARPGRTLLDDIALSADGSTLYGADFGKGEVIRIPVDGSAPTVVYSGLQAATSVLFGHGPTFPATSLYVTEGGGILDVDQNQRVLELTVQVAPGLRP